MSKPQIRSSQLITTFGPGAMVDLPDDAVIITGTDVWRYSRNSPPPLIAESRLQAKVEGLLGAKPIALKKPPAAVEDRGFTPDIRGYRFPEWFIVQHPFTSKRGYRARRLVHLNDLDKGRFRDEDGKKYPVVPVRFVRACKRGHVGDIDWHSFIHGTDTGCRRGLFVEERGTTGDLDAIWACCDCGETRVMSQAARMELRALGSCNGARPWLGPGTRESCGEANRLLIRSASNAYFPQLLSVISIPDSLAAVDGVVASLWDSHLSVVESEEQLRLIMRMGTVKERLGVFAIEQIMPAIRRRREGTEADSRPVKEVEFEALAQAKDELGADDPDGDFYARALPRDRWDAPWMEPVERVVLVHRLREVVAQVGFTRFEAAGPDIQGELDIDVQRAPLGVDTAWVPAVENRGEGVFIKFKADKVKDWLSRDAVKGRDAMLVAGFDAWRKEHKDSKRQYPGLPYYMLHSLSHLLLTAISLECGYPASSLRERVYAAPGCYGILIYTGSSDAEGTLGGLVEAGRRISDHMRRALDMGALCSNDPVCAFHRPDEPGHQPLLGAACHGCLLISETSCEQHNDFLDRALVVATVEGLAAELMGV
ncbi:MAG TPA: DUF1998 domain-containing protein [Phycisphaerae bacterium]|nr:DUF1998 domain-containing protein [Phycisphaerae bacterium]